MKVALTIELELTADPGDDEATDTWAWSLERQIEEMALVKKANVVDFEVER